MRIGIDFDNTIVRYDQAFHRAALEQKLIPPDLPANKSAVRDYLRSEGMEDQWTVLQGYIYGNRMDLASPWEGVKEFMSRCVRAGIPIFIISHKTHHPYQGQKYDLHEAAWNWLTKQGFFDPSVVGLERDQAFFELTLKEKLARIGTMGCTHFVDDLPEVLGEEDFPMQAHGILFDPAGIHSQITAVDRRENWGAIADFLLGEN